MNKKLLFLVIFACILGMGLSAQVLNPVKWEYSVKSAGNNTYKLVFHALIDQNWHLYSQHIAEGGPIPTSFDFNTDNHFTLMGKPEELSKPEVKFDKSFNLEIRLFSKEAVFVQEIKSISSDVFTVKGTIEYMCCDDRHCLPPHSDEFSIQVQPVSAAAIQNKTKVKDSIQESTSKPLVTAGHDTIKKEMANSDKSPANGENKLGGNSFWKFFLLALGAGLLGIVTPCVYPMIPMTVSFFMRGNEKRSHGIFKAVMFGISIIVIYTLIGLLVSLTRSSADVTSLISTHWIPNLLFFLLFVLFAASFFGMFEIVLPGSLSSKVDKQADKGGIVGSFFMALTLVIVSFSCTGPIVGALLVEASKGAFLTPVLGMFGFSLTFALPFVLFAISPALMKNLAKSGSWLNSVKVFMAFILLAFSLKFLLAIDTIHHFHILTRGIYLSIWIILFTLLGLYLAGKIKFAHDGELSYISFPRLLLIIAVFSFVLYLIPGLFGAPLKAISSMLPPEERSVNFLTTPSAESKGNLCESPLYADILELPKGLSGYFDYDQGMKCAHELNLPVFLDIKGHACSNCKVMDATVFSDPRIMEELSKNYIIIALYTDDPLKLPENKWIKSNLDGKVKKTMAAINQDIEISKFNNNALPFYAILTPEGSVIGTRQFDTNVDAFLQFLKMERKFRNCTKKIKTQ